MYNTINYRSVGMVHSPFLAPEGTPIQPAASNGTEAFIEIFTEFADGLKDLDGFSHIYVIYHLHLINKHPLTVIPFLDNEPHGVFATRSPGRPNPIGISVVKLVKIVGNSLIINNIDMLHGSPVLDIKPYIPQFDRFEITKNGWFDKRIHNMDTIKDDGRFIDNL